MKKLGALLAGIVLALTIATPALGYTFQRGPAVPEPPETGITFCILAWLRGQPC